MAYGWLIQLKSLDTTNKFLRLDQSIRGSRDMAFVGCYKDGSPRALPSLSRCTIGKQDIVQQCGRNASCSNYHLFGVAVRSWNQKDFLAASNNQECWTGNDDGTAYKRHDRFGSSIKKAPK